MTTSSANAPSEAYVWVWLPGTTEPVVAGRVAATAGGFQFNYGRTPWMWRIYAGSIVCFGLVPAAVFRWRSASWDSLSRKMENETEPSVRTPMAHRRSAQSVDALGLHEPLLAGDTNE